MDGSETRAMLRLRTAFFCLVSPIHPISIAICSTANIMPRGRPTKYSSERTRAICKALKEGCTRLAAAESVGVSYETLRAWMTNFLDFSVAVTRAEAECEVQYAAIVKMAATGVDQVSTTTTTRTVFKTRTITNPDGTVIEEPVALSEVTTARTETREFDWRAALEWLKRRRRAEWGDSLDLRKLDDATILQLLALEEGSEPERPADFDPARLADQ
jgi:hypothetical protein